MFAIFVIIGTGFARHHDDKGNLTCFLYQFCFGLDMLAMSVIKGTNYACHVDERGD